MIIKKKIIFSIAITLAMLLILGIGFPFVFITGFGAASGGDKTLALIYYLLLGICVLVFLGAVGVITYIWCRPPSENVVDGIMWVALYLLLFLTMNLFVSLTFMVLQFAPFPKVQKYMKPITRYAPVFILLWGFLCGVIALGTAGILLKNIF